MHVRPGGFQGPMVNALLAPVLPKVCDEFAGILAAAIEESHAPASDARVLRLVGHACVARKKRRARVAFKRWRRRWCLSARTTQTTSATFRWRAAPEKWDVTVSRRG